MSPRKGNLKYQTMQELGKSWFHGFMDSWLDGFMVCLNHINHPTILLTIQPSIIPHPKTDTCNQ